MSKENPYLVQLRKKYIDFLKSVVRGEPFTPIKLRGGTGKPGSTKELYDATTVFLEFEKNGNRPGWKILRPLHGRIEQEKLDQSFVQGYLLRKGLTS